MSTQDPKHQAAVAAAADTAESVLPLFEAHRPDDQRPRLAIEAARGWVRGEVSVGEARTAAFGAQAAARASTDPAAKSAARSAGHAAATVHVASHAPHANKYAELARAGVAD
jgi:hypothetical protein